MYNHIYDKTTTAQARIDVFPHSWHDISCHRSRHRSDRLHMAFHCIRVGIAGHGRQVVKKKINSLKSL